MECEIVRQALSERSLSELDELAPHFARCPSCMTLLERVREAESAIEASLDAFAHGGDFESAFARASEAQIVPLTESPSPSYRRLFTVLTAAAVALTVLVVSSSPSEESPAGETLLQPEPLASEDTGAPLEPIGPVAPVAPPAPVVAPLSRAAPLPEPIVPVSEPAKASLPSPVPEPVCEELDLDKRIELQDLAVAGKLTADQRRCVELALETHSDRLGLLSTLAMDAQIRGDKVATEAFSAQIRDEMGKDPELCYRGAMSPSIGAAEVIRLADLALDRQHVWTGRTRTKRVSDLYEARAMASLTQLEAQESDEARALAHRHAQEWHAHAQRSGRDEKAARAFCEKVGAACP